jgi:hypothetical protein
VCSPATDRDAAGLYVLTVCAVVAIGKRIVLPRIGRHRRSAPGSVRKWIADKL